VERVGSNLYVGVEKWGRYQFNGSTDGEERAIMPGVGDGGVILGGKLGCYHIQILLFSYSGGGLVMT